MPGINRTVTCIYPVQHQLLQMLKRKLNWRTPLFFCLLPIFLVMIFLGFPLPMAPPPKNKPVPEVSVQEEKRKRKRLDRIDL